MNQDSILDYLEEEDKEELENKYLTFWTIDQLFGVPIKHIVQIIEYQPITSIPDYPNYAKGVINLRGSIIPIIDIRARFGKGETQYNDRTCIVVTRLDKTYMGFIVDSVHEVLDLKKDEITDPPFISQGVDRFFLSGVGKQGDKVILILNVDKLFKSEDMELMLQK